MQVRELLNNQQFLNPLQSSKRSSGSTLLEGFGQMLSQKKTIQDFPKFELSKTLFTQKQTLEAKTFESKTFESKPNFKSDEHMNKHPLNSEKTNENAKVKSGSYEKVESKPKDSIHDSSENQIKSTDAENNAMKDLENKLKGKIKADTGLSDEQIDAVLASLNIKVEDLVQIEDFSSEDLSFLEGLHDSLVALDINEALGQNAYKGNLDKLIQNIEKLVDTLEKIMAVTPVKLVETEPVKTQQGSNHGVDTFKDSFKEKAIQELSRVLSVLNELNNGEQIPPEQIRKVIEEMMGTESKSPITSDAHIAKTEAVKITDGLNLEKSTPIIEENKTDAKTPEFKSALDPTNAKQTQTPVEETKADLKAENSNDSMVAVHQLAMKQPNVVTAPPVPTIDNLKQDAFSQVMDAIKGNIKLNDNGTSMLVKLQPEQLGNVELKLNLHKGVVIAEIKVENEMVKAAIESNLGDLKQTLLNKGYLVDQINVSVDSGKKENQEKFGFNQNNSNKQKGKKSQVEELSALDLNNKTNSYNRDEFDESTINIYG